MSELQIYESLERMVRAAEADDMQSVTRINDEFSSLLSGQYRHLPNWSMNPDVLKYDRVRNKAGSVASGWIPRDEGLREMRELFSQIPKPSP